MIKAIIFDLGGVLFTNGTNKFIFFLSDTYHLKKSTVSEIIDGKIGTKYRENKISREEFWRSVIDSLGLVVKKDDLEKKWIDGYEIIPQTYKLIKQLKKKYKVYFLSDNVRERVDALDKKYHFLNIFNGGVFSHEAGVRKPNPEIYWLILKKAGIDGSEAIYIDDKSKFTIPAKKLGMTTFVFKDTNRLKDDLLKIGILF